MTLLTAHLENPGGYGRIVRKKARQRRRKSHRRAEESDDGAAENPRDQRRLLRLRCHALFGNIDKLDTDNHHGEFYITDMAAILGKAKKPVVAVKASNAYEVLGGNTRAELSEIDQHMRLAKCRQLMDRGSHDSLS